MVLGVELDRCQLCCHDCNLIGFPVDNAVSTCGFSNVPNFFKSKNRHSAVISTLVLVCRLF